MKKSYSTLIFGLFLFLNLNIKAQIYVNIDAEGMNDGTSWEHAYTDLQEALINANEDTSIWVAAGTYLPDNTEGNVFATFLIERDLVLLGGFPAGGGIMAERDPATHQTILSGDQNGDDTPDDFTVNREDNVMTVLTISSNTTDETIIDGFTISHGHADGTGNDAEKNGGGIYSTGTPTIRNCIFEQNYALEVGGSIYQADNSSATVVIEDCTFANNHAGGAAAIYLFEAFFEVSNCEFLSNSHIAEIDLSGATAYILNPMGGTMQNCMFVGNTANISPGMIIWRRQNDDPGDVLVEVLDCVFNDNTSFMAQETSPASSAPLYLITGGYQSSYVVKRCIFYENNSAGNGGGISVQANTASDKASMLIDSCDFSNNIAQYNGCGLWTGMAGKDFNLHVSNCNFFDNRTLDLPYGAGALDLWGTNGGTGSASVDNCVFEGNIGGECGALWIGNAHNGGADMEFSVSNCIFQSNEATISGAIRVTCDDDSQNNVTIDDCDFNENTSTEAGGALWIGGGGNSNVQLNRCTITGNESPKGGAIYLRGNEAETSQVLIENSLIANNNSDAGAIFADTLSALNLLNCTVVENQANGIEIDNESNLTQQNTILYNPGFTEYQTLTNEVTTTSNGGNIIFDNSMDGLLLSTDQANTDPLLTSDYHPDTESPCIDMGVNMGNLAEFDLAGNPRVCESVVDIGAYEFCIVPVREIIVGELSVSPNPSSDFIHIQLPENVSGPITMHLFDDQGRLVKQFEVENGQGVYVGDLPGGAYFVKGITGEVSYLGRFVKL